MMKHLITWAMAALLPLSASAQNPEIHVTGNGIVILDGDNTPDYSDNTDYGLVKICGATAIRTFTIHNTGTDSLHLVNVWHSGTGGVYFSQLSVPAWVIEPGGSSSFQMMFDPGAPVTETVSLNIMSDDADEGLYNFTVIGTGYEPEIDVIGNSTYITDGDVTPSPADHTDFGNVGVCGTAGISRTFTIENNSPGNGLNGIAVTITGADASDFTLTAAPATGISWAQRTTTFTINFDPSAPGVRNATINISSDDCDENPFEFAITGFGDNPEAEVRGNSLEIVNGDNTPTGSDHTNFGSVLVCVGTIYRDFTILNTGNAPLTVGTPVLSGPHIIDYVLTVPPASTVAPGGSTFFRIVFNPSVTGLRSAAVSFSTNDCDENPYTFAIQGSGNADVVPPTAICQNISLHLNSSGTASIMPVMINNGSYDQCGTVILQSATPSAFTCSNVGPNNVTLTVADPAGNTSTCTSVVTVIDTVKPVAVCRNINLHLNTSGTALVTAPMLNNGSTDACGIASLAVSTNSFSCANIGTNNVTLTVTDVNGNSKSCTSIVTVLDTVKPVAQCQNISLHLNTSGTALVTAPMLNNGSTDACGIASLAVSTNSFSCANIGTNNVTLTVTDVNGNSKSCTSIVTVLDTVKPVAVCRNINLHLNTSGTALVTAPMLNNGSTDACGIASLAVSTNSFSCANIGTNNVTLTVTDVNGNSKSCTSIVTVLDTVKPVAQCQNISLYLNSSGTALITAPMLNNGSTDACGIASLAVSTNSFSCANIGTNNVTLTVTDVNGNSKSCSSIVTVVDTVKPVAVCRNINLHLNTSGTALVTAPMLNNGSTDACGIASLAVSTNSFSCANIGTNNVTLTVTDVNGNSKTCSSVVTVLDTVKPVAQCQNTSLQLNSSGTALITAPMLNNGSTDACGIASLAVSTNSFSCANIGTNNVTLTVTDVNGNSKSCSSIVTVVDTVKPVAVCRNINLHLNTSGTALVTAPMLNNGSTDACGIASLAVSTNSFSCANIGTNNVTLTVTDVNGNSKTCSSIVTVVDTVKPVAQCQNISLHLNTSGTALVTAPMLNNGSTDACGIASLAVSTNSFSCANIGTNNVTLTVTDVNGNSKTCSSIVTVLDTVKPVAQCQNISLYLNTSGTALITAPMLNNGSTDACGIASLAVSTNSFSCANIGTNNVTLTVTDVNGNSKTCTSIVTVLDTVKPVAQCQNISLYLNSSGTALITAPMLNNGSTDACGIASLAVSTNSFSCANIGTNNVTLTVTDVNGNSKTCTSIVTVLDTVKPVAQCQNISLHLNTSGTALITAPMLNNGSSDACGIASLAVSTNSFSCANIGTNNVTLTVTDVNGNSKTCSSIVTVLDTVRPVAICQNINVTLSGGTAAIAASAVNNGSADACGIASMTVVPSTFNCSNLGINNVMFTVTDASGNSSSCTAAVNVISNLAAGITSITDVNCFGGSDGSATVTPSGGAGPFTYNWLPAGGTNATASALAAGTYTCTVTDNGGCTTSQTVSISQPTLLTAGTAATTIYCNGDQAAISVTANGGTPAYSGTGSFTVTAGSYSYTVTDANGCTSTSSISVTEPPALIIGLSASTLLCNGDTATITVTASGGTPGYNGTGTFTVPAGTYTYTVTDANTCPDTASITVTQPAALSVSATPVNVSCFGGNNGSIDLSPGGGTLPYAFSWNNGTYLTEDLSGLSAGTYSWTVTDTNNCVISGTEIITSPPVLTVSVTAAAPTTCGGTDGAIDLAVNGGTGTYSYLWNTTDTTAVLNGLAAGTYSCVVTDENGCIIPAGVTLSDPPAPVVTFVLAPDTLCQSTTAPFALTGGLPQGGTYSGPGVNANQFDPALAQTGFNVITYTFTDTTGCAATASDSVWVDLCLGIPAATNPFQVRIVPNPNNGSFVLQTAGGSGLSVQIFNALGQLVMSNQLLPGESHLFEIGESGMYMLTATNTQGQRIVQRVFVNK